MATSNQEIMVQLVTGLDGHGQNLSWEEQKENLVVLLSRVTDFDNIEDVIFYKDLLINDLQNI